MCSLTRAAALWVSRTQEEKTTPVTPLSMHVVERKMGKVRLALALLPMMVIPFFFFNIITNSHHFLISRPAYAYILGLLAL
jgi:hypothetical protein